MKRIIDYNGQYEPKENEHVVRANVRFFNVDDLNGFDGVCISDESLVKDVDIEIVSTKKKRGSKK